LRCSDWCNAILANFNAKRIIVLDTISVIDYKTDNFELEPPLVRSLHTAADKQSSANSKSSVKYLEAPNLIAGAGACLVAKCQMRNLCAKVLVSLEHNHLLEVETVRAFEAALAGELLTCAIAFKNVSYSAALARTRRRKPNPLYL